jgi:hypothetical protein
VTAHAAVDKPSAAVGSGHAAGPGLFLYCRHHRQCNLGDRGTYPERDECRWVLSDYATNNAPALVVGNLVKFVGLPPSKESLVGALREARLT